MFVYKQYNCFVVKRIASIIDGGFSFYFLIK